MRLDYKDQVDLQALLEQMAREEKEVTLDLLDHKDKLEPLDLQVNVVNQV